MRFQRLRSPTRARHPAATAALALLLGLAAAPWAPARGQAADPGEASARAARDTAVPASVPVDSPLPPLEPVAAVRADRNGDGLPDRLGERVRVRGVVLSRARPTGRLSSIVNFQDSTGGVVLFRRDTVTLERLVPGDRVEVVGRLAHSEGMEEVRVDRLRRLGHAPLPPPLDVSAAEAMSEAMQGRLVRVNGVLDTGSGGLRPRVIDDSGEVPLYMRTAFLEQPGFGERLYSAHRAVVTGIAAQSDEEPPYDAGYDLMPRSANDFILIQPPPWRLLGFLVALLLVGGLAVYATVRGRTAERQAHRLERLTADLESRDHILEAVAFAAERFLGDDALEDQLEDVLARLLSATGVEGAALVEAGAARGGGAGDRGLGSGGGAGARLVGSYGVADAFREALERFSDGQQRHPQVREWVKRMRQGDTVQETPPSDPEIRALLAEHGVSGQLLIPVFVDGRWWGALAFYTFRAEQRWSEVEMEALSAAASIVGAALARREVQEALRQSEEQFRQSQKMEAVGRLAGGIAHDFNNLLTAMRGHGELLAEHEGLGEAGEDVAQILRSVDRASELTRQLLAFSRYQALPSQVTDASAVVAELEPMLQRLIGEHIRLRTRTGRPAWIRIPPGQLEQVVVNLCVNARDAMPEGGTLRIETAVERHGERSAGSTVVLRVADDGTGMDPETVARAMDPFFTTKPAGSGTGLGLSTVYGIATKAGGRIAIESAPGEGTEVAVRFPAVAEPPHRGDDPAGSAAEGAAGGQTILVAEDEAAVRTLATRVLTRAGYRVLAAKDGGTALELHDRDGPVDLLVTDVRMPGMSGPEVVEELRKRQPDVPALYISGYAAEELPLQSIPPESFLEKPFSPNELVRRVGAALRR